MRHASRNASLLAALLVAAATAVAQDRGTVAPGTSNDGSRPQDGAIQGGSIVPGERGGVPEGDGRRSGSPKAVERCEELSGKLREQCLLDEQQNSSTGATRRPDVGGTQPMPGTPPPQNPR